MSEVYSVLKIVGGVLLALALWNLFEHYQQRQAFDDGMRELNLISAGPGGRDSQATASRQGSRENAKGLEVHPVPQGFRCMDGALLKRIEGGWTQVTSRHNEVYCPKGGISDGCYRVSPASTGCG